MFLDSIEKFLFTQNSNELISEKLLDTLNIDLEIILKDSFPLYEGDLPTFELSVSKDNSADITLKSNTIFLEYVAEYYPHEMI